MVGYATKPRLGANSVKNFNLTTGFVIQKVKGQTLIIFYDSLYQLKASIYIAPFPKTETGPLTDTYSYSDWQSLQ